MSYFCRLLQLCALISFTSADFYKILGVSKKATHKEIKKAYRQKSLEFHPDKNKEEGAAEKFAEIARAYEVLSDEEKKTIYDRHGEEALKQHEQRQGGPGGGGGGDPFGDIFSHFFGHGHGGGRSGGHGNVPRTDDVNVPLRLDLSQLYKGATFDLFYHREVLCSRWEECTRSTPECSGPGVKVMRQQIAPGFVQQIQVNAPECVAPGKSWRTDCKACPEGKTQTEKIELTVDVGKGMRQNESITFEGVTDERPGFEAGDLNFVIEEIPHDTFTRDGDHLYMAYELSLVEALTGFSINLTHVDGSKFTVNFDDVTECDHVMRVQGKGMPRRNGRGFGDLYISFEVDFPDTLSQYQKDAIKKILASPENNDEL